MENNHNNTARRNCGKELSPRLKKLQESFYKNGGEFKEYKIQDLFEASNGDTDIQQKHINNNGYNVISSGLSNYGIIGQSDIKAKVFDEKTITIDMFGNVFARDFKYKLVTHARVFSLKLKNEDNNISFEALLYIATQLYFLNKVYNYNNMCSYNKIKDINIYLPILNNKIHFTYMHQYIKELQLERIQNIKTYLKSINLYDYNLEKNDRGGVNQLLDKEIELKEYKINDLFKKLTLKFKGNNFIKDRDLSTIANKEFNLPLINAKHGNNGIMYFGREDDWEYAENTIDIVNDGAISTGDVYPQPQKTGVLYNAYLIKPKFNITNPEILIYFATTIKKAIKYKYGYDKKASWEKVRNDYITIPTINNNPDFVYMFSLIKTLEKKIVKEVVNFTMIS